MKVRQSEKEEREEEGWSEEEWCSLLGGRGGDDDDDEDEEEEESRPGSDGAVLHARNPIYRPRHTQSLADLFWIKRATNILGGFGLRGIGR